MEQNPDIRKGRHWVHELSVHIVFVTKYRGNVFTQPMLTRCEEIMNNVCADFGCELMQFNGADDHVRQHLWDGHLWSRSYYAGSTGAANHATVSRYIQNQDRPTH
ncbi:IS200/IS605 family transposase [Nonomuraea guangzhouensis]|uniref:IS200/IS605 family transposase n=1 Tax=Nonomuraea guangzhouensis TaxID=1291555 RepID=A0ABW4G4K5_9ACTN|nr:IS200/IS605 family transposase [Nonomuraea guangzhouensis]